MRYAPARWPRGSVVIPFEMQMLGCAVVLGLVHILAAAHSASLQRGYRWTASARDEPVAPLTGVAGRLARALGNFSETFALFAALAIAVVVTGRTGTLSAWGAGLYLSGRIVYLPLYAFGVPFVRSLAWNVATAGIILLLFALLRG
jgi:uncharacterized MAPEG superfamily protein